MISWFPSRQIRSWLSEIRESLTSVDCAREKRYCRTADIQVSVARPLLTMQAFMSAHSMPSVEAGVRRSPIGQGPDTPATRRGVHDGLNNFYASPYTSYSGNPAYGGGGFGRFGAVPNFIPGDDTFFNFYDGLFGVGGGEGSASGSSTG